MLESRAKCLYFALRGEGRSCRPSVSAFTASHDIITPVALYLLVFQMKMEKICVALSSGFPHLDKCSTSSDIFIII